LQDQAKANSATEDLVKILSKPNKMFYFSVDCFFVNVLLFKISLAIGLAGMQANN